MNFKELPKIVARRWLLTLTGLLVTAGICLVLVASVPVSYSAKTSLVLLPPATVVEEGGNPYLYLGGLGQALDVLTRKINADEFSKPIEKIASDETFEAFADTSTSGPILIIAGTGPTAATALEQMNAATSAVPTALRDLQTSLAIPDKARITLASVAVDEKPEVNLRSRIQAVGAAALAGIALTLILAGSRDGRVLARRARQSTEALEADDVIPATQQQPVAPVR